MTVLPRNVDAACWKLDHTGWWYQEDNGSYPKNQWKFLNGSWALIFLKQRENHWGHESDETSSYEEVKEEYDEMVDEFSDDSVMFPNGRDYDAEDEEGI